MSSPQYVPDDRALFRLLDLGREQARVVAIVDGLNEMIKRGTLKFPKAVMYAVVDRHDPETDSNLVIWIKTACKFLDCKVEYSYTRDVQAWAQDNGYPDGLDTAPGRESCVVSIASYIMKLHSLGASCCVITDDHHPVPGRAALGAVCRELGIPTVSPADFLSYPLDAIINELATEDLFNLQPLGLGMDSEGTGSEPAAAD